MRVAMSEVDLIRAEPHHAVLLANLLELYVHELSELFDVHPNDEGRFGYEQLPRYWSEPERRFAFLIRAGERVAGFALATRGSPMSEDPEVLDVAEFFVLRRHRREGAGSRAAFLLWDRLPGNWMVRVLEKNAGAARFWTKTVRDYTRNHASETGRDGWQLFTFASR